MARVDLCCAALAAGFSALSLCAARASAAGPIPPYTLGNSFSLVADAWDVTSDGRVLTINGNVLSLQNTPGGSTYSPIGSIAPGLISTFGASFLRLSPDGTQVALGDNNFGPGAKVYIANLASAGSGPFPTIAIDAPNAAAAWADSHTLYVSGFGLGSQLTRLDTFTRTAQTVVSNIGDGSGGVAIRSGKLYTGIGFDFGTATGDIRSFDLAALSSATSPVDFSTGLFTANALSASSLDFDAAGNLLVGGGDFFSSSPDFGYAAVIDISAGPPGPPRLQLSPAGPGEFYGIRFNSALNELLVTAGDKAYRYAVPTPGAAALFTLALPLATRRRRPGTSTTKASRHALAAGPDGVR